MIFRILKRDLKRKRTMNIIMLLLLILATVFVSAGLANVVAVLNGSDYFMDIAGIYDYTVISLDRIDEQHWAEILDKDFVQEYKTEPMLAATQLTNSQKSDNQKSCSTPLIQSIRASGMTFFDKSNNKVTGVSDGHIMVPAYIYKDWDINIGDTLYLTFDGEEYEFIVEDYFKDAMFGSAFMGNKRFLISENDYNSIESKTENCFSIISINTTDLSRLSSLVSAEQVSSSIPKSTLKMTFFLDTIIAAIILILSICLIIAAAIVMKFTISFTITEEYREIGVMKAIGITNARIRSIYLIKYAALAVIAAIIGFFVSLPLCDLLLESVSFNMVLGDSNQIIYCIAGTLTVILLAVLFAYISTGKVKKASPVDAVRSGSTGERFSKKSVLHISKHRMSTPVFMALNDFLSHPKRYMAIVISLLICTVFILIMSVTVSTLNGEGILGMITARSDLYFWNNSEYTSGFSFSSLRKADFAEQIKKHEEKIKELGIPGKVSTDIMYSLPFEFEGTRYSTNFFLGLGSEMDDYEYSKGSAPQAWNEIAITSVISDMYGIEIGDTITIFTEDTGHEYLVTAYYESLLNLGQSIRLHCDAPVENEELSGNLCFTVKFNDTPDSETIAQRRELLKQEWNVTTVYTGAEYVRTFIGTVLDSLESVKLLLSAITVIVLILITVLLEQSFVSDEKSQIALLKATGFRSSRIRLWHILRFIIAALFAIVGAMILLYPLMIICINPLFGLMGSSNISYEYNLPEILLFFPAMILSVTALAAFISSLSTNKIRSRDTANIE